MGSFFRYYDLVARVYHRCPGPVCASGVEAQAVFCDSCWGRLTTEIKERISVEWSPEDKYSNGFTAAILDAVRYLRAKLEGNNA